MALDPMAMLQMGGSAGIQPGNLTPEQLLQILSMLGGSGAGGQQGNGAGVAAGAGGVGGSMPPNPLGGQPNDIAALLATLNQQTPMTPPPSQIAGAPTGNVVPNGSGAPMPGGNLPPELIAILAQGGGGASGMGPIPGGPAPQISQNPSVNASPAVSSPPPGMHQMPDGSMMPDSAMGGGGPPIGPSGPGAPPSTPPQPADVNSRTPAQIVAEDDSKIWLDALQRMTQINAEGLNGALAGSINDPVRAAQAARSYDPGAQQNRLEALLAMLSRKAPAGGGGPPQAGPGGPGRATSGGGA